jgi:hypothetical protein
VNVNCKVTLTDDERNKMFRKLNGSNGKGMVSRAEVNCFVKKKIAEVLNGTAAPEKTIDLLDPTTHHIAFEEKTDDAFKPTRGDEPYIFKAKDESLRAIHTRMLDCIEEYERAVWTEMEKNRI